MALTMSVTADKVGKHQRDVQLIILNVEHLCSSFKTFRVYYGILIMLRAIYVCT
jgi:hypothetical protein